jgi:hypothetical protein
MIAWFIKDPPAQDCTAKMQYGVFCSHGQITAEATKK